MHNVGIEFKQEAGGENEGKVVTEVAEKIA